MECKSVGKEKCQQRDNWDVAARSEAEYSRGTPGQMVKERYSSDLSRSRDVRTASVLLLHVTPTMISAADNEHEDETADESKGTPVTPYDGHTIP